MKQVSGITFSRLIEKKDWVLNRIKGSHFIYKHDDFNFIISIPSLWKPTTQTWFVEVFNEVSIY